MDCHFINRNARPQHVANGSSQLLDRYLFSAFCFLLSASCFDMLTLQDSRLNYLLGIRTA